jgi:hypothetical protein
MTSSAAPSARPVSRLRTGRVRRTRTRRGIRLSQHGVVLSEMLHRPGPTHSVADVLAALLHMQGLSADTCIAVLGFAGGGLVAPLRALGCEAAVEGVDLDIRGHRLFKELCGAWAGRVQCEQADALLWLAAQRQDFHAIVDDLSVPLDDDVCKPGVSWVELPGLIRSRLGARGIALLNWLPPSHASWRAALRTAAAFFPEVRVVTFKDYENQILIGARTLPDARQVAIRLNQTLRQLGSRLAARVSVRSILPGD